MRPEVGVTLTETVALVPPVFCSESPRPVDEPLVSVAVVGIEVAETEMYAGLATVRFAVPVWAVTLSPVAVTVIV